MNSSGVSNPFTFWPQVSLVIARKEFDLDAALECGQVFHWRRDGAGWQGAIGDLPVFIEQRADELLIPAHSQEVVSRYFSLDHPLGEICASFPTDPAMREATQFCQGMRIIRQPLWECLATFITSSMKQVSHIAQMSQAIRRSFGHRLEGPGGEIFAYPTPERLARATEAELRGCGLGFRAPNLLSTARLIAGGEVDLEAIASLEDDSARAALCRLPGVGVKVANCVLLFAYERLRAFPVDVWIERILRERYFARKRNVTPTRLKDFANSYFGPFGGYAQQYLFHHARKTWRKEQRGKKASRPWA